MLWTYAAKIGVLLFAAFAMTTSIMHLRQRDNENQMVFVPTVDNFLVDKSATDAAQSAAWTYTNVLVDTRMLRADEKYNAKIYFTSIGASGKDLADKTPVEYKYSTQCMDGSNTACADCYNGLDDLSTISNAIVRDIVPVQDLTTSKSSCYIQDMTAKGQQWATFIKPKVSFGIAVEILDISNGADMQTLPAEMPKTKNKHMTRLHTGAYTALICFYVVLLILIFVAMLLKQTEKRGYQKAEFICFTLLMFLIVLFYGGRDVETCNLDKVGHLRSWTRNAMEKLPAAYTDPDGNDFKYKEFAYNDVVTYFGKCVAKVEGSSPLSYKIDLDIAGCKDDIPQAMSAQTELTGTSLWVYTYAALFFTFGFYTVVIYIRDNDLSEAIDSNTVSKTINPAFTGRT